MTPAEEKDAKRRFAETLTRIPNPLAAACVLWPDDTRVAAWVAVHWVNDAEVLAEKTRLQENEDLPNKKRLARDIWNRMQMPCMPDDYAKLAKLYAEINSFIEKPGPGVVAQIIVPKVIEVPNHGTDSEWEARAEKQQRDLLSVSRSKN